MIISMYDDLLFVYCFIVDFDYNNAIYLTWCSYEIYMLLLLDINQWLRHKVSMDETLSNQFFLPKTSTYISSSSKAM